jgi:hypothetical protein
MPQEPEGTQQDNYDAASAARREFRDALLLHVREGRDRDADVTAAAARLCEALRREGISPERMLADAKQVIHDTIDGDHKALAENAVTTCIEHYYRA